VDKSTLQALTATSISIWAGSCVYWLAKKQKLNFRYAVGWLTLCVIGVFAGLGTSVIEPIAQSLGITASALIGLTAMLLLVLLAIQLSVSISGLQLQNRRLAEQLAILGHTSNILLEAPRNNESVLDRSNVLILIPAFNEVLNLGDVVIDILNDEYKVLVIDDGSSDETKNIAIELGVDVLVLPFNLGVGGALKAGFKRACELNFLAVIQVDADGQHQTKEIARLLHEANSTEAHLVIGSRFRSSHNELLIGKSRRLVIKMLARSASGATATEITDPTSGFRLIRQPLLREFSQNFPINYLGDTYEALVSAGRAGYIVREVPAAMKKRTHGVSSATNVQAIKFIVKSILVATVRLHIRIPRYVAHNPQKSQ
jgi:hypothetical protein